MTLYDIAKLANVSPSSVSRVLNNRPGVNSQTRKVILEIIEKNHYTPNAIARGMVNQRFKAIGVLVADIRNAQHTESAYCVENRLTGAGYLSYIINTGYEDRSKYESIALLQDRRVDGLITIGSVFQTKAVKKAIKAYFPTEPVVMINGELDLPNVNSILTDESSGVNELFKHLSLTGRKKIAFVSDNHDVPSAQRKMVLFVSYLEDKTLNPSEWIYKSESSLAGSAAITRRILMEHPDVDTICYTSDIQAAGGVQYLISKGVPIPKQIAVTGIDNSDFSRITTPKLTTLDYHRSQSAITAANSILDLLSGHSVPRVQNVLPTLVVREST